ncbi:hypothetical protein NP493_229g03077 [Ridgeia piscesae]|uniref:Uncharacterized protein n=1 Tax=Ridgeia piscesae TaxID=27915 RepID=A0AAD9UDS1_RIDPI|nr:hypothetical protein NP493_229g03077 [Ridgeia piscesae]
MAHVAKSVGRMPPVYSSEIKHRRRHTGNAAPEAIANNNGGILRGCCFSARARVYTGYRIPGEDAGARRQPSGRRAFRRSQSPPLPVHARAATTETRCGGAGTAEEGRGRDTLRAAADEISRR